MDHGTMGECGSCDKEQRLHDVGAYDGSKFCEACIRKFGPATLASASNAALAARKVPKKRATCLRCNAPLVMGSRNMCSACNAVYRDTFGKEVVWK